jgi:hypothetical protein
MPDYTLGRGRLPYRPEAGCKRPSTDSPRAGTGAEYACGDHSSDVARTDSHDGIERLVQRIEGGPVQGLRRLDDLLDGSRS